MGYYGGQQKHRKPLISPKEFILKQHMKTYCKNIDITNPKVILSWIQLCLMDPKRKNRKSFKRLINQYGGPMGIAQEITKRIQNRDLALDPIIYSNRVDKSNGKMRRLGIETPMQQCMDYIAVYALKPLILAKLGVFQCASIPYRGQSYGKRTLEKWVHKDIPNTHYYDKIDIRHCFENIQPEILEKLLQRDIRKNPVLIWFILALVHTFEKGLSIGSFLSQWLCNYVISYAYHYSEEQIYKIRREKRIKLIKHILIYMDDMILFSSSKRDLKMGLKRLEKYLLTFLGLSIKVNHHIKIIDKESPDMMGFVVNKNCTIIRDRTFIKARRAFLRVKRRLAQYLPIQVPNARRIISYYGYFKHTNTLAVQKKLHVEIIMLIARKTTAYYDCTGKQLQIYRGKNQ